MNRTPNGRMSRYANVLGGVCYLAPIKEHVRAAAVPMPQVRREPLRPGVPQVPDLPRADGAHVD